MNGQPYLNEATHWCAQCEAPIYYDGDNLVDARAGETFDLCRESTDGSGPHRTGKRITTPLTPETLP